MMQNNGSVRYSHPIFHGSLDQESKPEFPIPRQPRREGGREGEGEGEGRGRGVGMGAPAPPKGCEGPPFC